MYLRVSCIDREEFYNLTESKEIYFNKSCNFNKITFEKFNNETYFNVDIKDEFIKPNLSVKNEISDHWNIPSQLNRYKIDLIKQKRDLSKVKQEFNDSRNTTNFNFFDKIKIVFHF